VTTFLLRAPSSPRFNVQPATSVRLIVRVHPFASPANLCTPRGKRLGWGPGRPQAWTTALAAQMNETHLFPLDLSTASRPRLPLAAGLERSCPTPSPRRLSPPPWTPAPFTSGHSETLSFPTPAKCPRLPTKEARGSHRGKARIILQPPRQWRRPRLRNRKSKELKSQPEKAWPREGKKNFFGLLQRPVPDDWRINESDGRIDQSPTSIPLTPACLPIRKRNRVSARFRRGRGAGLQLGHSGVFPGVLQTRCEADGCEDMSDSTGENARLRRYPELPVWVVEDHQEVSWRLPDPEA
jgi:hypothetical protein